MQKPAAGNQMHFISWSSAGVCTTIKAKTVCYSEHQYVVTERQGEKTSVMSTEKQ